MKGVRGGVGAGGVGGVRGLGGCVVRLGREKGIPAHLRAFEVQSPSARGRVRC